MYKSKNLFNNAGTRVTFIFIPYLRVLILSLRRVPYLDLKKIARKNFRITDLDDKEI